ncbi:MAG: hypothetical protein WC001_07940 [Desulfurivibrionaceae bacterium]
MKKVLATVAVSTALVMGGAVAASAAGIEMEGSVRVRGLSEQKITPHSAPYNTYDEQVRIGMKSKPSDNLTGYILLETGSGSSDTWGWGQETTSSLYRGGTNFDNQLNIIQAWMAYNPTKELTLKVGHMPIAPGTKQFVNHDNSGDDAIVLAWDPNKSTHVHVATIKLNEGVGNDNSDDLDAYALVATQKFSDSLKMGANLVHIKGGSPDDGAFLSITYPGIALSNLGVDAEYKMGNLTLKGDVNLQFGTISETLVAAQNVDAEGYAFQLAADYKIDNSNVGLLLGVGSGVDPDGATLNDQVGNAFVNFLGDSAYQVYIPGYRKVTPGSFQAAIGQTDGANSGLSNLTLYQLNAKTATTCPLTGKKLSVRGAFSYMRTTEDVNNYGTNREDEIGTEVDIVAAWALTSNLTYQIEAAYLWTGDVYKTSATSSPEDAYFLRHGITMKF